ncbi:hypothetical protein AUQ39_11965 [Lacticaseibacillus casei]|nr:hypothetical protein AAW28_13205 [Lacticaseibacillus casei]OLS05639.1 hypothetical protein AUQ39_11965 [Lacticaseibacillus casei]
MDKTIKQLATELGVSKQTIQYHYQRLPANRRQKDQQGRNVAYQPVLWCVTDDLHLVVNSSKNNFQKIFSFTKNHVRLKPSSIYETVVV